MQWIAAAMAGHDTVGVTDTKLTASRARHGCQGLGACARRLRRPRCNPLTDRNPLTRSFAIFTFDDTAGNQHTTGSDAPTFTHFRG